MSWSVIIALVLQFVGPILAKLIADLLRSAKPGSTPDGLDAPAGMARLFTAAADQTWWWQFRKRAALAIAERVCVNRAGEFWSAAKAGAPAPVPTAAERRQFDAA